MSSVGARRVLITGANRGLGLEFVKQYVADGFEVLAVTRTEPTEELLKLTKRTYKCDLADPGAVPSLKKAVGDEPLDIVINNAGAYPHCNSAVRMTDKECEDFAAALNINTISPLRLAGLFAGNLSAKAGGLKKMIFITSKMGSIADNGSGGSYGYRASKAALNAVGKSLQYELPDITVLMVHPGWVRTRMGGAGGLIDAVESVTGMRKVIAEEQRSGLFVDYKGETIPW